MIFGDSEVALIACVLGVEVVIGIRFSILNVRWSVDLGSLLVILRLHLPGIVLRGRLLRLYRTYVLGECLAIAG